MANVMTHIGKLAGVLVLLGDISKTFVALSISCLAFYDRIGWISVQYAGLGAVLGHDFPYWRGFRGGKGVTTSCAWFIMAFGLWGIISDLVGAGTVFLTGWLPLGAVLITLAMIPLSFIQEGPEVGILVIISFILMCSRHFAGLKRIFSGQEERHLKLINWR